jgi:hypothetical protein
VCTWVCIGYRKCRLHFQSRENRQCHVSVSGVTEPPEAPRQIFKCVCVGGGVGWKTKKKSPDLPPPLPPRQWAPKHPPVSTQTSPGYATGVCSGEGGGWQNTWGPECSEGPGNLGKMFVLFINALCLFWMKSLIVVIDRKTTKCEINDFSIVFSAKTVS